ncbi:hypothetical protein KR51_00010490 [Rubidibacter lacunae KORDI 51-2]|uniref:Sulfotransferase domain protein n=1 Tax=Rubidibacter lacunae KORDI 51-2 TaxID=582515 RepID=U5DNU2_9CHRO|nr:sulfotransferase [Rubidibacter lacunae]ERN42274.1 hypothetical protein KR51_00010490 [Rubidibacter lacunae KORDI 51-2]
MKRRVVFVIGTAHSGSTLLSLLLGSHPDCWGVGELNQLQNYYHLGTPGAIAQAAIGRSRARGLKICVVCEKGTCPLWDAAIAPDTFSLDRLSLALAELGEGGYLARGLQNLQNLLRQRFGAYTYLLDTSGKAALIDSSKSLSWVRNQLSAPEFRSGRLDWYVVYLARDGRAIVNSALRKRPELGIERASHRWQQQVAGLEKFLAELPPERYHQLSYEDLSTATPETLADLCTHLGLDFNPAMLVYWQADHHPIGGNIGAHSLILKAGRRDVWKPGLGTQTSRGQEFLQRKWKFYEDTGFAVKVDLRWQDELTAEELACFEAIAGATNAAYRYDP